MPFKFAVSRLWPHNSPDIRREEEGTAVFAGEEPRVAASLEDRLGVLFITDDGGLADLYRLKLSIDGYDLRVASREESWLTSGPVPDLVFLDLEDGNPDAVEAWRRLRSAPRFGQVPVILLTSPHPLPMPGLELGPLDHLMPIGSRREAAASMSILAAARSSSG
jgi:PleD family two-component response regulator